jgi:hypothetical protein
MWWFSTRLEDNYVILGTVWWEFFSFLLVEDVNEKMVM